MLAILGCNGSGKTTLACLERPRRAAGQFPWTATVGGHPAPRLARRVGMLLQTRRLLGTVADYVLLGVSLIRRGMKRISGWRGCLAAGEYGGLARRLATLSGGERQRARIAQLLAQAPLLYCLDEPLQHLDLRHQAQTMALFRDLARAAQQAVVMVLHEPWWAARYCSHALLLFDDGAALAGEPAPC
jgi:iron complex transport system ATP-binding protein